MYNWHKGANVFSSHYFPKSAYTLPTPSNLKQPPKSQFFRPHNGYDSSNPTQPNPTHHHHT